MRIRVPQPMRACGGARRRRRGVSAAGVPPGRVFGHGGGGTTVTPREVAAVAEDAACLLLYCLSAGLRGAAGERGGARRTRMGPHGGGGGGRRGGAVGTGRRPARCARATLWVATGRAQPLGPCHADGPGQLCRAGLVRCAASALGVVAPHRRLCRLASRRVSGRCRGGWGAPGGVPRWPSRSFCPRRPVDDAAHRRVLVAESAAVAAVAVESTTLHWARVACLDLVMRSLTPPHPPAARVQGRPSGGRTRRRPRAPRPPHGGATRRHVGLPAGLPRGG